MNMTGVFAGAAVTQVLGKWTDGGDLGLGFAILGGIVVLALASALLPTTNNRQYGVGNVYNCLLLSHIIASPTHEQPPFRGLKVEGNNVYGKDYWIN